MSSRHTELSDSCFSIAFDESEFVKASDTWECHVSFSFDMPIRNDSDGLHGFALRLDK